MGLRNGRMRNGRIKSNISRCHWYQGTFFLVVIILLLNIGITNESSATLTIPRGSVTPTVGSPDDTYVFLVTYKDSENIPPKYIRLVIDDKAYDLAAVSGGDDNYTAGKDYMIKLELKEGIYVYYFETSNGKENITTAASTIRVRADSKYTHMDVVYGLLFSTAIILIPISYTIYLLRKIVKQKTKPMDNLPSQETSHKGKNKK